MSADLPRLFPSALHMLADATEKRPSSPAIESSAGTITYLEYARCAAGMAHMLEKHAVEGATVLVVMHNSIEMAITIFGIAAAGATLCTVNPAYTVRELRQIILDADPKVIIVQPDYATVVSQAADAATPCIVFDDAQDWLSRWKTDDSLTLDTEKLNPDAIGVLQYTGGTSGRSKGVQLTHRAISTNVSQREAILPTRLDDEHVLCIMPMFHSFASAMCLYLTLNCRGRLVIHERYHPDRVTAALANDGITIFPAGPTVFISLLGFAPFRAAPPPSLRWCFSGSAALSEATMRDWEASTACRIYEGYGQSEAGPILTYNAPDDGFRLRSVGRALPGTYLEIVDPVDGTTLLPVGVPGEIRASGPQIMQGYRNLTEETQATLRNGWLYTGDVGRLDSDGFLQIEDRKKDMVIVSGYNVFPREIDEVLAMFDGVAEVATIGAPDSYRGEALHSFVVARPDKGLHAESLLAHCAENLAKYKIPKTIRIVDHLPKTSVGKIDRQKLRQDFPAAE